MRQDWKKRYIFDFETSTECITSWRYLCPLYFYLLKFYCWIPSPVNCAFAWQQKQLIIKQLIVLLCLETSQTCSTGICSCGRKSLKESERQFCQNWLLITLMQVQQRKRKYILIANGILSGAVIKGHTITNSKTICGNCVLYSYTTVGIHCTKCKWNH